MSNLNVNNITPLAGTSGTVSVSGSLLTSGNSTLGDATTDTHIFTGNITASGALSASGTITANAFAGDGSGITGVTGEWDGTHTGTATFTGNVTASGNISSSGTITGNSIVGTLATAAQTNITSIGTVTSGNVTAILPSGILSSSVAGTLSSSAQIATNISGALGTNATLIRTLTAVGISGSTATGLTGTPDITVGSITATNINTVNITSSIVTASVIYSSGSNIFGDASSDTHKFNGDITASGVISASGDLEIRSITASGNIHAGTYGNVYGNYLKADVWQEKSGTSNYIQFNGSDHKASIVNCGTDTAVFDNTFIQFERNITASGTISARGDLYAAGIELPDNADIKWAGDSNHRIVTTGNPNDLDIYADRNLRLYPDNDVMIHEGGSEYAYFEGGERRFRINGTISSSGAINTDSHITASGNISASGNILTSGDITSLGTVSADNINIQILMMDFTLVALKSCK